jgi:hypothetical protein
MPVARRIHQIEDEQQLDHWRDAAPGPVKKG